jgi:hypothetical protein
MERAGKVCYRNWCISLSLGERARVRERFSSFVSFVSFVFLCSKFVSIRVHSWFISTLFAPVGEKGQGEGL